MYSSMYNQEIEKQYIEAKAFLDGIPQYRAGYGVDRASKMLELLGHPEKNFKIIHVAGTNGKGSVCLYLHDILVANGYKTGLFTSPHLTSIRERIRINGQMISKKDFMSDFFKIKEIDEKLGNDYLAYFDYFLGIAVLEYAKANVEFAVIETGLGGRLDATNALCDKIISVITTISLEHTAVLGDTVEKIAKEKAGIIKKNGIVVYNDCNKESSAVISYVARDNNSVAIPVRRDNIINYKLTENCIDFSVSSEYYSNDCLKIGTKALYQMDNCHEALVSLKALEDKRVLKLDDSKTRQAIYKAYWPGRMDEIRNKLFVDGAHNPEGIKRFVENVPLIAKESKKLLLFSVVSDKDFKQMVKIITDSNAFDKIAVTQIEGARKLDKDAIQKAFLEEGFDESKLTVFKGVHEALDSLIQESIKDNAYIFAAGSLYLISDILEDDSLERYEDK